MHALLSSHLPSTKVFMSVYTVDTHKNTHMHTHQRTHKDTLSTLSIICGTFLLVVK